MAVTRDDRSKENVDKLEYDPHRFEKPAEE